MDGMKKRLAKAMKSMGISSQNTRSFQGEGRVLGTRDDDQMRRDDGRSALTVREPTKPSSSSSSSHAAAAAAAAAAKRASDATQHGRFAASQTAPSRAGAAHSEATCTHEHTCAPHNHTSQKRGEESTQDVTEKKQEDEAGTRELELDESWREAVRRESARATGEPAATLQRLCANVLRDASNERYRKLRLSNPKVAAVCEDDQCGALLRLIGFERLPMIADDADGEDEEWMVLFAADAYLERLKLEAVLAALSSQQQAM